MPTPKPTLLIVDDDPENLTVLLEVVPSEFRLRAASRGLRALEQPECAAVNGWR